MISLKDNEVSDLLAAPLTLTTAWQDVGTIINIGDIENLGIWVDLTINASLDPQVRVLAYKTPDAADGFEMPIHFVSSGKVDVNPQIFELPDANSKLVIGINSLDVISFIKFQAKVLTLGATAATLNKLGVQGNLLAKRG